MINLTFSSAVGSNFASIYPELNKALFENGTVVNSRYGVTKEFLSFRTEYYNPIARCVGGQGRDINIFFLLAEALWIWSGRYDVEFLTMFNSRMSEFSDNGKTFHAPYGFRLRDWGIGTDSVDMLKVGTGKDQIKQACRLLSENNENRRVVLSIWNPDLDLFPIEPTKDTPCNVLWMLKVREGKLHGSIANRSNDLHWGLPTNVFQFSFLLEIMAHIIGVGVGSQVHMSDSLHIYTNNDNNKIHEKMYERQVSQMDTTTLYHYVNPTEMDFSYKSVHHVWQHRLEEMDYGVDRILHCLKNRKDGNDDVIVLSHSNYLFYIYHLLSLYIDYTKSKRDDASRLAAIFNICKLQHLFPALCHDYLMLALNWFHARLKDEEAVQASLSEIRMLNALPELSNVDFSIIGKL